MMDENEQESAQRFYTKFSSLSFNNIMLKLQLLLPMAILLSFLLTFTSYNNYDHYHMFAFVLPLFTHTFEKKYLFILCTTILTFITKKNPHLGLKENTHHDKLLYVISEMDGATVVDEHGYLKEEHEKNMEKDEKESEVLIEDEEADGEVFEEEGFLGGVEEEHAEIMMNMDTKELNKKIEEFIKKMREELRVEAEQHLITV